MKIYTALRYLPEHDLLSADITKPGKQPWQRLVLEELSTQRAQLVGHAEISYLFLEQHFNDMIRRV